MEQGDPTSAFLTGSPQDNSGFSTDQQQPSTFQAPPPQQQAVDPKDYAFTKLKNAGYTDNAAHAAVAMLAGESGQGLNTGVYQNEGGYGPKGTSWSNLGRPLRPAAETAGGIANWNGTRATMLLDYAKQHGQDPNSLDTQLNYFIHTAGDYGIDPKSTQNPAILTAKWTGSFENPAINNGSARWANYTNDGYSEQLPGDISAYLPGNSQPATGGAPAANAIANAISTGSTGQPSAASQPSTGMGSVVSPDSIVGKVTNMFSPGAVQGQQVAANGQQGLTLGQRLQMLGAALMARDNPSGASALSSLAQAQNKVNTSNQIKDLGTSGNMRVQMNPDGTYKYTPIPAGAQDQETNKVVKVVPSPDGQGMTYWYADGTNKTIKPTGDSGTSVPDPNSIDPSISGDDYLKAAGITGDNAAAIKDIASGRRLMPTPYQQSKDPQMKAIANGVYRYDPSYQAGTGEARVNYLKGMASTSPASVGGQVNSLNMMLAHAQQLEGDVGAMDNTNFPVWNAAKNAYETQTGETAPGNFTSDSTGFSEELARLLKGGPPSVSEINAQKQDLNAAKSPQQLQEIIQHKVTMAMGRMDSLQTQRDNVMGRQTSSVVNEENRDYFNHIKSLGLSKPKQGGTQGSQAPTQSQTPQVGSGGPQVNSGVPNSASPLDRARAAIAAGAPRDKVIERLKQNGIDPTGL